MTSDVAQVRDTHTYIIVLLYLCLFQFDQQSSSYHDKIYSFHGPSNAISIQLFCMDEQYEMRLYIHTYTMCNEVIYTQCVMRFTILLSHIDLLISYQLYLKYFQ